MYDGREVGFCVDVHAEVLPYVELYKYVEVYGGHEARFCVDVYAHVQ